MTQSDTPNRLTPKQRAYVAALIGGQSQMAAATVCGMSRATASRYMALESVRAALNEAQNEALGVVTRRLNAGAIAALDVLEQVMNGKKTPASVKVRCAQILLDAGFKARELLDLDSRLSELEVRLSGVTT